MGDFKSWCTRAGGKEWFYDEANAIDSLILYKTLNSYGSIGSQAGIDKNKRKLYGLTLKNYIHDILKMINNFEATLSQIESKVSISCASSIGF